MNQIYSGIAALQDPTSQLEDGEDIELNSECRLFVEYIKHCQLNVNSLFLFHKNIPGDSKISCI